ncbi:MAG TPA: DNA polymerase III subunit gamma/tau [Solirubrobacterales bacterium]|nr:DNA polymerase III subunit gamma/tau [Solirubrobacterales bacterium]
MSESTSLYRRHRPGSFDEVVGQTHVVRTLRNAVEQGKVHHAYLFVGSRGTGKTSMAKILARSLNCERGGPTVTPCGECESCVTIAAGTSVDVIEMDAASNRSVDDVRDLRERVAYAPAGGHWKVYILDEAHMLTKEAWNAFLKTLEEPPPNTVFVLATTESHKVMATIADRCQRFDFQRPSLEQISEVLTRVAATEQIEVDEGAVAMIARSASGSFRDALGTLDQLVAFGGNHVKLEDVLEMLGAADADLLFEAVDAVVAEDPKGVLLGVERMARSGRDPSQFARDLLAHLRHLLITQTTGEVPTGFVVTATDTARMQAQATAIRPGNLVRTIDELADALTAVREGDDARLAVEIALLKAARPDLDPDTAGLLRRIERLEQQDGGARPAGPVSGTSLSPAGESPAPSPPGADPPPADDPPIEPSPNDPPAPAPQEDPPPAEEEEAEVAPPPESEPSAEAAPPAGGDDREDSPGRESPRSETGPAGQSPPAPPAELSLDEIQRVWPAVLQKLEETAPALAGALEGARPVSFGESGLEVGFPPDMTFLKKNADSPEKRDTVAAAFAAVTGTGLRPTYVVLDGEAPPDTPAPGSDQVNEEELLERLKSEFDAEEVG